MERKILGYKDFLKKSKGYQGLTTYAKADKGWSKNLWEEEIEEAADPMIVTSKDEMRISDIVKKSAGNTGKILDLARRMANSITDGYKALRRARAAESENYHEMASIFFKRAMELGAR